LQSASLGQAQRPQPSLWVAHPFPEGVPSQILRRAGRGSSHFAIEALTPERLAEEGEPARFGSRCSRRDARGFWTPNEEWAASR
jgi:hypothetical protein